MKLEDAIPNIHPLIIGDDEIELSMPIGQPSYEKVLRSEQRALAYRGSALDPVDVAESQAEVSYWRSVKSLFDAAELVGASDLPDVDLPDTSKSVFMERCGLVEEWAEEVLRQADEIANPKAEDDAKPAS